MFWPKAVTATLGQIKTHMIDVASCAKSLYVGGTVAVKRRWEGWIGGPRGSCRGHRADWEVMQVISVQRLGSGPDAETELIRFMKSYTAKTKKVTRTKA